MQQCSLAASWTEKAFILNLDLVPLTSDKGLCGGINSSVVRELKTYVKDKNRAKIRIMPIGEKGS